MTWPTVPIVTTAMDAGTDTPPRDQIKAMADAVNDMIATPPSAGAGRLLKVTRFVPGTYTFVPDPAATKAVVTLQAPGGGGGGAATTTAGNRALGAGGGGGALASFYFSSIPSGTKTIYVGSGGSAGSGSGGAGGDGSGDSAFVWPGGNVTAGFGSGGLGGASFPAANFDSGGGGSGGAASFTGVAGIGEIVHAVNGKSASRTLSLGATSAIGGAGGDSSSGPGATPVYLTTGRTSGNSASGYGGGGGGGATGNAASIGGGAGASGYAIVLEYS